MWNSMSSSFCRLFGIETAIIQAPMANGPTTPALVAASSNAGALGSFAAGYMSAASLQTAIREIKQRTNRPFCVNVFSGVGNETVKLPSEAAKARLREVAQAVGLTDISVPSVAGSVPDVLGEQIEVIIRENVPIVSTTFGLLPDAVKDRLQNRSVPIIATATCVDEAKQSMRQAIPPLLCKDSKRVVIEVVSPPFKRRRHWSD